MQVTDPKIINKRLVAYLLVCVFVILASCENKKGEAGKTAKEIYQSGVMDTADFELIVRDTNAVRDTLRYKYDSDLIVQRNYHYGFREIQGFAFYYKGKPEGKWTLLRARGDTQAVFLFKNGLKHGDWRSFYDNGIVQFKTHYENDKEVYRIQYDSTGNIIDSIGFQ